MQKWKKNLGVILIVLGAFLIVPKMFTLGIPGGCGMMAGQTESTGWSCGLGSELGIIAILGLVLVGTGIVICFRLRKI